MISLPGGTFTMGSPNGEEGRSDDEGPQREVKVQSFAVGQYEVTFEEWNACVDDGGCTQKPGDPAGWRRPVIGISWNDAQGYVTWLKGKSGKPYRLLSGAEWEYAARAGTTTPFALPAPDGSDDITGKGLAHCDGCGSKWLGRQPAPVGSYAANTFGLHDTVGNVWEWVEDCWNDAYEGAPRDGSTWWQGSCIWRVVRGGSWSDHPGELRSANRDGYVPDARYDYLGFRVSKILTP